MILKVLSLNIWNINPPLEERLNRLADYLAEQSPHIVALQEISPYGSAHQSDWIASKSRYRHVYYTRNGDWQGREEGLAVLTSLNSSELDAVHLPLAHGDMPRTLQLIRVNPDDNGSFILGNTHLAFHINSRAARVLQIRAVLDGLSQASRRELPVILCGDLNDVPESEPVRQLFTDSEFDFQDSWDVAGDGSEGITFAKENPWANSALWPGRRIDFIAASRDFVIHSCRLAMTQNDWAAVSDHYAVFTELELTS